MALHFKDGMYLCYVRTLCLPRSKHSPSWLYVKTNLLILCEAQFAVCSEIHTKHTNSCWSQRRITEC